MAKAVTKKAAKSAVIEFPVVTPSGGNCSRSVETELTRRQAAALKAVYTACRGVEDCEVYSAEGSKPVSNPANAIRWLLDRVADAHEDVTGGSLVETEGLTF